MIRTFTIAKISKSNGRYSWVGSCSDDRVDVKNTRLTKEIYEDFIAQANGEKGMPFLGVAHYPDSRVAVFSQLWVDGHYLKNSGYFDETELASTTVESLHKDAHRPARIIQFRRNSLNF